MFGHESVPLFREARDAPALAHGVPHKLERDALPEPPVVALGQEHGAHPGVARLPRGDVERRVRRRVHLAEPIGRRPLRAGRW